MSDIVVMRDIDIITTEIKVIEQQVAKAAIYGCIEIGKRLVEAKEMVGHGGWGKYLEEKVRYSQQWATNLMNLYKEYGSSQESLFENFANSKSFGNIDVTKHILLMSVPAEEREQFAAEHDAENATTRELQAAIRERNEALQERDDNLREYQQLKEQNERITAGMVEAADKLEALQEAEQLAKQEAKEAQEKLTDLQGKLTKAKENEKKAKDALKAAQENPEIPESVMESLRAEVAAEAAKKATEDLQKQLDALTKEKADAEALAQDAKAKLEAAQKQLVLASPDAAVFKSIFQQVQEDFNRLNGALLKVQQADPETADKLRGAVKKLLEKLLKDIGA